MLSYQDQYEMCQDLASDNDDTNKTLFKQLVNVGQHKLEATLGIYFTEETRTITTVTDAISGTSYQSYKLPENFRSLIEVFVTVGTTQYQGHLIRDEDLWREMNSTTTQSTSDYLQFVYIKKDRIELYPIPSTAKTMTIRYNVMGKDLTQDDYTTGTITTLANAGTAVTGSGTTWTSSMAGRYFKINSDGEWYKISAFGTTTTLTLDSKYQGIAIAAGTENYTIGQMPSTPDDTHILPVYYALWHYFQGVRKNVEQARDYHRMWKEGLVDAKTNWANKTMSSVVYDARHYRNLRMPNPNDYPSDLT